MGFLDGLMLQWNKWRGKGKNSVPSPLRCSVPGHRLPSQADGTGAEAAPQSKPGIGSQAAASRAATGATVVVPSQGDGTGATGSPRGSDPVGPIVLEPQPHQEEPQDPPVPWFTTRCGVCDREIEFYLNISPGEFKPFDATVLVAQCEQCAARIAAVIPPVQIVEADTLTLRNVDLVHNGYSNQDL